MNSPPMSSWDEIVRTHSARIYHFAYRLTGNRYDAEDLTHDVFIRVFRYLPTYRPNTFEGWLYRITTNLFFDQVRHKNRIRSVQLTDAARDRLPGREPTPAQVLEDHTIGPDIQLALAELDPRLRAAVLLRDVECLSYREIAAALNIEVGTVGSRVHRARTQLRSALAHRTPHPGRSGGDYFW